MEWHKIFDPNSPDLDRLAERYHLHPLHIEDCRHRNQSAKIEEDPGYIFTVMKGVRLDCGGRAADRRPRHLSWDRISSSRWWKTIARRCETLMDQVAKASETDPRADQVYYRIIDHMVDTYLPVLDHYERRHRRAGGSGAGSAHAADAGRYLFETKRNLIVLRRVLVNTRDVANHLQRTESPYISRDMWPFLRDVYDHVARNLDTVEMLRDLLTGALDVYLSSVANRTNQVMKVLTVLGTVALPAVVVSSIYGMNVKGLPGAESPYALPSYSP